MSFNVFIPARFASTRLPGKPLAEAGGRPLVQWVYDAACRSAAGRVVIATDNEHVMEAAVSFGAEACLTRGDHASGTDRICEAAQALGVDSEAVIVNLQGDEPSMPAELIDGVAAALVDTPGADIATVAHAVDDEDDLGNPNVVKVVCDRRGRALYFSRSLVPYPRDKQADTVVYRHLGLYAYRFDYLRELTSREPTMLERTECLEQLRALEYGDTIAVHVAAHAPPAGIDTPEDLERFRREVSHG